MKIKITKQEVVEGDISEDDAKIFIEKYIIKRLLKLDYMTYDYYNTYSYIIEKNKICLLIEINHGHYNARECRIIRDATEEDIAIFKTLEVLKKQK